MGDEGDARLAGGWQLGYRRVRLALDIHESDRSV
jgi:hypothetical protein